MVGNECLSELDSHFYPVQDRHDKFQPPDLPRGGHHQCRVPRSDSVKLFRRRVGWLVLDDGQYWLMIAKSGWWLWVLGVFGTVPDIFLALDQGPLKRGTTTWALSQEKEGDAVADWMEFVKRWLVNLSSWLDMVSILMLRPYRSHIW